MTTNLAWKASLPFAVLFFTRTSGGNMETTSRKTECPVTKILQRYIKELKLTALLALDQTNFFNKANLFSLSRKPFVMCYCFREPIKTFFLDACQMIVKLRVLHLFPVLQTGRSHIINILLALFFRSVLWITNPRFFSIDLWPKRIDGKKLAP